MKKLPEDVDPKKAAAAFARAAKIRAVAAHYKGMAPKKKFEDMTSANVAAPLGFNQTTVDDMPKFGPIGSVLVVPDEDGQFKITLDYGDGPMDLETGIATSEEAESLAQTYRDEYGGGEEIKAPVAESKKGTNTMNISKLLEAVTKGGNPDTLLNGLFEEDTDAAEISSGSDVGDSLNIDPNEPGDDDTGTPDKFLPDAEAFPDDDEPEEELASKDDVDADEMEVAAYSAFDGEGDGFMESKTPQERLMFRQRVRESLKALLGEEDEMMAASATPTDDDKAAVSDEVEKDDEFEQGTDRPEDTAPAPTNITVENRKKAKRLKESRTGYTNQKYFAQERGLVEAEHGHLTERAPASPDDSMRDFFEQFDKSLTEDEADRASAFKPEEFPVADDDLLHPGATGGDEITAANDPENGTGGILGGDTEYGDTAEPQPKAKDSTEGPDEDDEEKPAEMEEPYKAESLSLDDRLRGLRYLNEEDTPNPFVKKGEDDKKDDKKDDDSSPSSDETDSDSDDDSDDEEPDDSSTAHDSDDDEDDDDDDQVEFPSKDADDKESDSEDSEDDEKDSDSEDDSDDDEKKSDDDKKDDDKGSGQPPWLKKKEENIGRELGRGAVDSFVSGIADRAAEGVWAAGGKLGKRFKKKKRHEGLLSGKMLENAIDDFLDSKEDETVLKKVENKNRSKRIKESIYDKQLTMGMTVHYAGSSSEVPSGTKGTIVDQESSAGGYMYLVAFVGRNAPLLCNQSDLTV